MKTIHELRTPSLLIDREAFEHNLVTMSRALSGNRLRPHVKAHKCTAIAQRQRKLAHHNFTCATAREAIGMAEAGLGEDLLIANEILDLDVLREVARVDARVTIAVDSPETVAAAAKAGLREVMIDVNVGLPRCGIAPEKAGALGDEARSAGLQVRGVMGYEGHCVGNPDRAERERLCNEAMEKLMAAYRDVGGDVISAGGTGTFDCNRSATEIQAGSYVLMDTAYQSLDIPFQAALYVWSTVISVSENYAVCDAGLKSFGMDHGTPTVELAGAKTLFCSDEHTTFIVEGGGSLPAIGQRVLLRPAHIDPTMAYHPVVHLVSEEQVLETWEIDLRGW